MSSTTRWRRALRRCATVLAGTTTVILIGAGAAFAFPSGGNPGTTGPNHIEWTGQGATNGQVDSSQCDAANDPNGANQPYLLWVFTTDGGSVATDSTAPHFLPQIHLSGSGSGDFGQAAPLSSNSVHFVTPYFTPNASLLASVTFYATSVPNTNSSWNLVISHGCAGPGQASSPTVIKNAAGAFTTTENWKITKSADQTQVDVKPGGTAQFTYHVTVTNTGSTVSGVQVTGTITVNNPNNAAITLQDPIVDNLSGGVTCQIAGNGPGLTLAPGNGNQFAYSCNLDPSADLSNITNTVTIDWADQTLGDGSFLGHGNASDTVPVAFTGTTVDNCVTPSDPQAPPGTFSDVCASNPGPGQLLAPQTFTYQVSVPAPTPDGTCVEQDNTAIIQDSNGNTLDSAGTKGHVCSGADLVVTKDATPSFQRVYTWQIQKSLGPGQPAEVDTSGGPQTVDYAVTLTHDQGTDSGWLVTGQIHVHNPNTWEDVSLQNLADSIDGGGTCTVDGKPGLTIPKNSTVDYNYQCVFTSQPPYNTPLTNTATATWLDQYFTPGTQASGTATATFDTGSLHNPDVTGDQVTVNDSLAGNLGTLGLDPNPDTIYYSYTFPADPAGTCTVHPNTATFTDNNGGTGLSGASVKICVGEDLSVAKTANPSFDRTYNWDITKKASATRIIGGHVTYTVVASQDTTTPFTDGNYQIKGVITVANPNDFEAIQLTSLTDSLGGCALNSPLPSGGVSIPASQSASFPYTCGPYKANAGAGTNVATAGWTGGFTPHQSATGSAPFDFSSVGPTNRTNQTIHVTDSQGGPLGTAGPATDSPPYASQTFTYTKDFAEGGNPCTTINNIATITETGQTANASVLNCSLGALTMGYWQNKNGQATIKAAPNPPALGNYLYNLGLPTGQPFSGLGANASNSTVASYFTTVFGLANASGNGAPMLKAQLLATALNVQLASQIGAPGPIGTAVIDLTNVGGVNVSAAFNNQSSMTVNQMIAWTASHSNVGGTAFYGGDKNLTTLAITAFNGINNDQVTGP
jgi:hypothetical protein